MVDFGLDICEFSSSMDKAKTSHLTTCVIPLPISSPVPAPVPVPKPVPAPVPVPKPVPAPVPAPITVTYFFEGHFKGIHCDVDSLFESQTIVGGVCNPGSSGSFLLSYKSQGTNISQTNSTYLSSNCSGPVSIQTEDFFLSASDCIPLENANSVLYLLLEKAPVIDQYGLQKRRVKK